MMNKIEELSKTPVVVISGHYGSGKTEISVNLALQIRQLTSEPVTIADLDLINPYFRSREKKGYLEERDIHLIGGSIEDSQTGVPALSAEVQARLSLIRGVMLLDTGGDPEGIRVLGRYEEELTRLREEKRLCHYFVFNPFRPETATPEAGEAMLRQIEQGSGVPVDRLICNSHLLKATGPEEVLSGWRMTEELARKTNLPAALCALPDWVDPPEEIPREKRLVLTLQMRSGWMS